MSERQALLGKRVELRQLRHRRAAGCDALKTGLRQLLDPVREPHELDRDAILDTAASLHGELGELAVIDKKLAILKRELGG